MPDGRPRAFSLPHEERIRALTDKSQPDAAPTADGTERETISSALTDLMIELQKQDVEPAILELAHKLDQALSQAVKALPDKA